MFDTETMAELCVKQGLLDEAIGIYRRLATEVSDASTRRRFEARIESLDRRSTLAPLETTGLRVEVDGEEAHIEWRLPDDTVGPALQALVLRRTSDGIVTETRTMTLTSLRGHLILRIPGLHSVRAAAGRGAGEAFVPLARVTPLADANPGTKPPRRGSDVI